MWYTKNLVVVLGLIYVCSAQFCPQGTPFREVDHVLLGIASEKEAEVVYNLLINKLKLPAAWPFYSDQGLYSGGVSVGNINIETIKYTGIGFEPCGSFNDTVATLETRGISLQVLPSAPGPYGFDNVALTAITSPDYTTLFFGCKYHFNEMSRREFLWQKLLEGPNPLDIQYAERVVYGLPQDQLKTALEQMELLFAPLSPKYTNNDTMYALNTGSAGPSLYVTQSESYGLQEVWLVTSNYSKAMAEMKNLDLLGYVDEGNCCTTLKVPTSVSLKICAKRSLMLPESTACPN